MGQQVGILKYQLWGKRHRAWPITCSHLQPEKFCGNNFVLCFPLLRIWKSINLEICIVDLTLWWRNSWKYYSYTLRRWFSPLATFSLRLLGLCSLAESSLHSPIWKENPILAEMVGHSLVCYSPLHGPTLNECQAWVSILNVVSQRDFEMQTVGFSKRLYVPNGRDHFF